MRTIRFRDTSLQFTQDCAVCLNWAHQTVAFERTFVFGRRNQTLKLPVPLCSDHARQARKRSSAQIWCERVAWVGGILLGLSASVGLFTYWRQTGQGHLIGTITMAAFTGASLGVTFWAIMAFYIVPLLADKKTKAVLQSVRMTRFDPRRHLLDVRFQNDTFAELTARSNLSILDIDSTNLKRYHLSAAIHSDDVRLNGSLRSDVLLDHIPTEREARDLLEPPAQAAMAHCAGQGCFYEILVTEIQEIPLPSPPPSLDLTGF